MNLIQRMFNHVPKEKLAAAVYVDLLALACRTGAPLVCFGWCSGGPAVGSAPKRVLSIGSFCERDPAITVSSVICSVQTLVSLARDGAA
jgi:hypothetical protein